MLDRFRVYAVLPATDLARAKAWWEEKVGMTPATEDPGGLWYACAEGTWVVITPSGFAGTAQNTAISFTVTEVERLMEELRASGVVFEEYETPKTVEPACTAIWKGNRLMTPIGGGVQMEPLRAVQHESRLKDEKGTVKQAHGSVKLDGLAKGQWWWD